MSQAKTLMVYEAEVGETYLTEAGAEVVLVERDKVGGSLRSKRYGHVVKVPLEYDLVRRPEAATKPASSPQVDEAPSTGDDLKRIVIESIQAPNGEPFQDLLRTCCARFPASRDIDVRIRLLINRLVRDGELRRSDGDRIQLAR